jgi:glycerophosphoryl diester phosphodiesterase
MDELRITHPEVATGLIVGGEGSLLDCVRHAAERGHRWVASYWTLVGEEGGAVEAAGEGGIELYAWGLDDPAAAPALAELGVSGLIVDDPPPFIEALAVAG